MSKEIPTNNEIAALLDQIANLLEIQGDNPHRIRAYRNGAKSVRLSEKPLAGLALAEDSAALEALPDIGKSLTALIIEFVNTGRSTLLDRLQGHVSPEDLFIKIPGIGEELAHRIAHELDIETLEELEQAAYDGRLREIEGFGPRRVEAVRASLDTLLRRSAWWRARRLAAADRKREMDQRDHPAVKLLLAVDAKYRREAEAGKLKKITPRRFNPEQKAWLPIMHAQYDAWIFTALFSNTARAHLVGSTQDWVVIYYERDGKEGQCTVVTEWRGPLTGKRVIRGREAECLRYYKLAEETDYDKDQTGHHL
jgi:DNA polymerase (family 10)